MDSDKLRPVVLALLCVLALGAAAATLNSTVETDSGGGFGVGDPQTGTGASNSSDTGASIGNSSDAAASVPIDLPCYPVLDELWAIGLILAVFLLGAALAYRRFGGLGFVAYVGPVGLPVAFAHALLTLCSDPGPGELTAGLIGSNNSSLPPGGSGAAGSGSGTTLTDPSVLLLLGLGVALVAAVALLFVSSSGTDPDDPEEVFEPDADEDVAAVGRAAGAAADRIEDATDVANEVYRAWHEMTRHLDVSNPESSTPAEFAAAAVDAGMAREDVAELTALFEEVRYGGESATDDRERRALDALRNIEAEYADVDGETRRDERDQGGEP
ncbi:DUF4129 domain-containing protein [Halorussus amylolyticus]|uniref:DUF4129 domain-containing protein n=1 Tax=Halorussus amylolyticus TaxID=1126242 RepID=UPI00104C0596|nr:DUF4129 domain-containing protein [Halorussus amylolyticus]